MYSAIAPWATVQHWVFGTVTALSVRQLAVRRHAFTCYSVGLAWRQPKPTMCVAVPYSSNTCSTYSTVRTVLVCVERDHCRIGRAKSRDVNPVQCKKPRCGGGVWVCSARPAQYGVQHIAQCSRVHYNTAQYCTVRAYSAYSTAQYSTTQYCTVQHST